MLRTSICRGVIRKIDKHTKRLLLLGGKWLSGLSRLGLRLTGLHALLHCTSGNNSPVDLVPPAFKSYWTSIITKKGNTVDDSLNTIGTTVSGCLIPTLKKVGLAVSEGSGKIIAIPLRYRFKVSRFLFPVTSVPQGESYYIKVPVEATVLQCMRPFMIILCCMQPSVYSA